MSQPLTGYSWSGIKMSSSRSVAISEKASYRLSACFWISDVRKRALRGDCLSYSSYLAFAASLICSGDFFSTVTTPTMFAIIVSAYILIIRKLKDTVVGLERDLQCKALLRGNNRSNTAVEQGFTSIG